MAGLKGDSTAVLTASVLTARYARASEDAKKLPPKLLTNSQRLRLYALFKQAEEPAPAQAPSYFNAIARAKWEAWNDCRSLTAEQAMESYCAIIEGLVAITQGTPPARRQADEAAPPPALAPSAATASTANTAAKPAAAPATAGAPASEPAPAAAASAANAPAKPAAAPATAVALASEPDEPAVDTQRWAATALSLGPGAVFEVPIVVAEPSRCRYCFHVAAADGSVIGFTIGLAGEVPLVTSRGAQGEGEVDVVSSGSMLIARLDNNASVFSHTVVACEVRLGRIAAPPPWLTRRLGVTDGRGRGSRPRLCVFPLGVARFARSARCTRHVPRESGETRRARRSQGAGTRPCRFPRSPQV